MESVLLSQSTSFPNDALAHKFAAVKVDDFFLSTGSAFAPLLKDLDADCDVILNAFRELEFNAILSVEDDENFEIYPVYCVAIHRSQLIETSFDDDFQEIEFDNRLQSFKLTPSILGIILLFSEHKNRENIEDGIRKICRHILPINYKMVGNPVTVVSTPYKNLSLFNSHSRGIICNVFGKDQCMFLTDVRLTCECEGSPVFSIYGDLIGMIMGVFTWSKGEWMGFSLAVHLYPILKAWIKSIPNFSHTIEKSFLCIGDGDISSYGVVVVSTPNKWGSGIILNKQNGIVLTCSHVVDFAVTTGDVLVQYKRKSYIAKVLYATQKNSPYDIAVLEINMVDSDEIVEFKSPTSVVRKGEAVYVIAYPLFSFTKATIKGPSVAYGHVSNVYPDVMILTSCATNSGASGGALVRPNGELLGIVTNNITMPTENLLIPHITVAAPSSIFLEPVRRFAASKDLNEFSGFKSPDKNVQDIWQLTHTKRIMKSKM